MRRAPVLARAVLLGTGDAEADEREELGGRGVLPADARVCDPCERLARICIPTPYLSRRVAQACVMFRHKLCGTYKQHECLQQMCPTLLRERYGSISQIGSAPAYCGSKPLTSPASRPSISAFWPIVHHSATTAPARRCASAASRPTAPASADEQVSTAARFFEHSAGSLHGSDQAHKALHCVLAPAVHIHL